MMHMYVWGGHTMNVRKIADVMHVSTRTVYRDLARMRNALKEVEKERKILFMEELFPVE